MLGDSDKYQKERNQRQRINDRTRKRTADPAMNKENE